jgi:hypothetical protein
MGATKIEASMVIASLWARVQALAKESGSSTAEVLNSEKRELRDQPLDDRDCLDPVEVDLLVNGTLGEDQPEVQAALAHLEACDSCLDLVCLAIPSEEELSQFMAKLREHEAMARTSGNVPAEGMSPTAAARGAAGASARR